MSKHFSDLCVEQKNRTVRYANPSNRLEPITSVHSWLFMSLPPSKITHWSDPNCSNRFESYSLASLQMVYAENSRVPAD